MSDQDRFRAACDRAIAAMQQPRPCIIGQTAPLLFASRPTPSMPHYMHPDFGMRMKVAPAPEKARPPGLPVVVSTLD